MLLPALSVVIPCLNEGGNIEPFCAEIRAALRDVPDWEIVVVDDGSSDDTAAKVRELGKADPRVRLVRHRSSCGQSAAIATGIRAARNAVIATLDGDCQNDPADIPRLLEVLRSGEAGGLRMVCGWRRRRHDTWVKRLSSRVANGVRGRLLGDNTPDTGCGLKVYRREFFLQLPYFDHMHRFLPALTLRQGGRVTSVEVNHRPRLQGRSAYGTFDRLWVGIWDLLGVAWLQRRMKRPEIVEN